VGFCVVAALLGVAGFAIFGVGFGVVAALLGVEAGFAFFGLVEAAASQSLRFGGMVVTFGHGAVWQCLFFSVSVAPPLGGRIRRNPWGGKPKGML